MYQKASKRMLDVLFALAALIVSAPLMLLMAAVIRADDGGPALFRQKRVGRDGRLFTIIKFRTMKKDAPRDLATHLMRDLDAQTTRVGGFLRRTGLDELPQLWNILRGDMSLVGPRPALWNQYDLIAAREQNGASAVRPGLTGLAQVNGRELLTVAEKAKLDGLYAHQISLALDCRCILKTFAVVIRKNK